ncbi:von Willebrand factor-like [Asterias rubens]|uniref:von Willebrand factor-like n=1 Tax=Asterias rubens TaxID=7604 RepID=UPI001455A86C|nr:von Willebrand factor-like [Asterias rubens]
MARELCRYLLFLAGVVLCIERSSATLGLLKVEEPCMRIERLLYNPSTWQNVSSIFEWRKESSYVLRWVCCDGIELPNICGKPICNPPCSEFTELCRREDRMCVSSNPSELGALGLPLLEGSLSPIPIVPSMTPFFDGHLDDVLVTFDGVTNVGILPADIYKADDEGNSLRGLCGNYDGNPRNDHGAESVEVFAPRYKFPDAHCPLPQASHLKPFDTDLPNHVTEECWRFATNGLFRACRMVIPVEPFFDRCMFAMAICEKDGSFCDLCEIYASYSRECAHHLIAVEWRTENFCNIECDNGKRYKECGTACPMTCKNVFFPEKCTLPWVSGCQCPAGTLEEGDVCVEKESCSCDQYGEVYPSGSLIEEDCEVCVCMEGMLDQCTPKIPCHAACTILGGRYFNSFDGLNFEFEGNCEYVLAQNATSEVPKVKVADELIVYGVNQPKQNMRLPYKKIDGDSSIIVKRLSSMVCQMRLPTLGIQILWGNDNRIYIIAEDKLLGKINGLCGNYNKIQSDDFTLPTGDRVSVVRDFTPAWSSDYTCKEKPSDSLLNFCELYSLVDAETNAICGLLKAHPFSKCNSRVDMTKYHKQCKMDRCIHSEGAECLAMSAYAQECSRKGIVIEWRTPELCHVPCFLGQVYKECGSSCKVSCLDLSNTDCKERCIQGCQCPDGEVLDDETEKCVKVADCSCQFEGHDFSHGQKWNSDCNDCVCLNGVANCTDKICTSANQDCPMNQEYIDCVHCERKCENIHLACRRISCTPGCGCPDGMVRIGNDQCMPQSQCPCYFNGQSYGSGDVFFNGCRTW